MPCASQQSPSAASRRTGRHVGSQAAYVRAPGHMRRVATPAPGGSPTSEGGSQGRTALARRPLLLGCHVITHLLRTLRGARAAGLMVRPRALPMSRELPRVCPGLTAPWPATDGVYRHVLAPPTAGEHHCARAAPAEPRRRGPRAPASQQPPRRDGQRLGGQGAGGGGGRGSWAGGPAARRFSCPCTHARAPPGRRQALDAG